MTLENLFAIHKLLRQDPERDSVRRLLLAAARNIADAKVERISTENRFDAAYKAIMQCAMAALWANGYRTSTSHQTAIQTLPKSIGLDQETVIVLDTLRKQRNLSNYAGDPVSDAALAECIQQAERLNERVRAWIAANKPDLA